MRARSKCRIRWISMVMLASLFLGLAGLGCSGNRRVSVGGSVHRSSGGGWGHSIGIGIQSHGRRR